MVGGVCQGMIGSRASRTRSGAVLLVAALALSACSSTSIDDGSSAQPAPVSSQPGPLPTVPPQDFGSPPPFGQGDLDAAVQDAVDGLLVAAASGAGGSLDGQTGAITRMGSSGDARLGWLFSDLLRFTQG